MWRDEVRLKFPDIVQCVAKHVASDSIVLRAPGDMNDTINRTLLCFDYRSFNALKINVADLEKFTGLFITLDDDGGYILYVASKDRNNRNRNINKRRRTLIHEVVHLVMCRSYIDDEYCEATAIRYCNDQSLIDKISLMV